MGGRGLGALAALVVMGVLWPGVASADPPANDDFADAQALVTGVAVTGDTTEAGSEEGEPVHSTWVAPNGSVWFTWTPQASGLARVSACGSAFDTVVAVYGGSALPGLYATRLANNDDGCGSSAASIVHLRVTAGTTYRIVLDGWSGGDEGVYQLVAEIPGDPGAPPANDEVGAATPIAGSAVHATGTNVGATSGWNEWPARATQLVWWHWTSPVDGEVVVDTCDSDFDTLLGVMRRDGGDWAGGDIAGDGCGGKGKVTVDAVKGREYWIGVGGEAGTAGAIDLRIAATSDVTPPVTTVTSGPPPRWGRSVARIEWSVEDDAATTTECRVDDGVWFGCAGAESLEGLQEGDHVFRVRSTDQYGNAEDPGAEHRFAVEIPEAANDDFATAAVLVSGSAVAVNNGKASAEPGEPAHDSWYYEHGLEAAFSVWFTFTPPADATAELDWCASEFDVVAAVYTGATVRSLERVDAWGDDQCHGSFPVKRGVAYHLAVDGSARNRDYGTGPIEVGLAYTGVAPQDPGIGSTSAPPHVPLPEGDPVAAATLRLATPGRLSARVDKRGRFSIAGARLHCPSSRACTVRVQVRTRRTGGRRIGGAKLTIDPAGAQRLAARLERPARRRLARRGRTRAWIRVALGDGTAVTRRITLLAPRRP